MPETWKSDRAINPPLELAVLLDATVRCDVEEARLSYSTMIAPERLRHALEHPPEWTFRPWSGGEARGRGADKLALEKMAALLAFRANLDGITVDELRAGVYSRFPEAKSLSDKGPLAIAQAGIKRIDVSIGIRADDGSAEWSMSVPKEGVLPPGITSELTDDGADLKFFVQNLLRAEIEARLTRI